MTSDSLNREVYSLQLASVSGSWDYLLGIPIQSVCARACVCDQRERARECLGGAQGAHCAGNVARLAAV